jgi:hypothetical protein
MTKIGGIFLSGLIGSIPEPPDGLTSYERAKKLQGWINRAVESGKYTVTNMRAPLYFPYNPDDPDITIDCKGCAVVNHFGVIAIDPHEAPKWGDQFEPGVKKVPEKRRIIVEHGRPYEYKGTHWLSSEGILHIYDDETIIATMNGWSRVYYDD